MRPMRRDRSCGFVPSFTKDKIFIWYDVGQLAFFVIFVSEKEDDNARHNSNSNSVYLSRLFNRACFKIQSLNVKLKTYQNLKKTA